MDINSLKMRCTKVITLQLAFYLFIKKLGKWVRYVDALIWFMREYQINKSVPKWRASKPNVFYFYHTHL